LAQLLFSGYGLLLKPKVDVESEKSAHPKQINLCVTPTENIP
jgi:hypothetical protein